MLFGQKRHAFAALALALMSAPATPQAAKPDAPVLNPSQWPQIAEVDPHYLSFNIEMAEVTGGEFWAPYGDPQKRRLAPRPALDLTDPRLRLLVSGLSPSLIRVSGTWANSTYVPALDEAAPVVAPNGFKHVLRQDQWRALTSLAKSTNSPLLLSFPASAGARDTAGKWRDEQASRLVALTRKGQAAIKAVEFINEPNLVSLGSLPSGYGATDYARDFRGFIAFARRDIPEATILGHSASGQGGELPAAEIAREASGLSDAISYHFYGALSERCAEYGNQTSPNEALSENWLAKTDTDRAWYAGLRHRYDPGKPIWLTETAQAACGGDRWAATFRDSFRFVDQLGRLAQSGVKVVAHNTLASGDYALIDRERVEPRPNYWAAWLWKRHMGTRVLQPVQHRSGLRLYAHCHATKKGGVAVVAIVLADETKIVELEQKTLVSTLTAELLDAGNVRLNGKTPHFSKMPAQNYRGTRVDAGLLQLPPHSINFIEWPDAANRVCR